MACYACGKETSQRCSRCGNPYCPEHGDALCGTCLSPASAAPSGTVFRGSLLALLVGSVLALWLLIRPPGLPGESEKAVQPLPTQPQASTPLPPLPVTPSPTPQPSPQATPTPTATPSPGFVEYTVQEGDSLYDIAVQFGTTAEAIAAANGIDINNPIIHPGQVLKILQAR